VAEVCEWQKANAYFSRAINTIPTMTPADTRRQRRERKQRRAYLTSIWASATFSGATHSAEELDDGVVADSLFGVDVKAARLATAAAAARARDGDGTRVLALVLFRVPHGDVAAGA